MYIFMQHKKKKNLKVFIFKLKKNRSNNIKSMLEDMKAVNI